MPTIQFEANFFGDETEADAPLGGALVDLCDAVEAPVPFSCRSATCGTCRIEVISGLELFAAPGPDETALLAALGDGPTIRLACQAELRSGPGVVRLRIADEEL
jgi:ferredoxin